MHLGKVSHILKIVLLASVGVFVHGCIDFGELDCLDRDALCSSSVEGSKLKADSGVPDLATTDEGAQVDALTGLDSSVPVEDTLPPDQEIPTDQNLLDQSLDAMTALDSATSCVPEFCHECENGMQIQIPNDPRCGLELHGERRVCLDHYEREEDGCRLFQSIATPNTCSEGKCLTPETFCSESESVVDCPSESCSNSPNGTQCSYFSYEGRARLGVCYHRECKSIRNMCEMTANLISLPLCDFDRDQLMCYFATDRQSCHELCSQAKLTCRSAARLTQPFCDGVVNESEVVNCFDVGNLRCGCGEPNSLD